MTTRRLDIVYASDILRQLDNVLIVTHVKPDGDALGSALGLWAVMRANMRRARVLLPEPLPEKYRELAGGADYLTEISLEEMQAFDAVIVLDCARADRIACGGVSPFPPEGVSMLNIDHHADNNVPAEWSCVTGDAAATAELIVRMCVLIGWKMTPLAASCFLLGIMTDTGSFRYANTSPDTFRTTAYLLENDAARDRLVNAVYYTKPRNQQLFEAEMVRDHSKLDFAGQYAYAVLPDELFAKYDFSMRDGEMLIELLREIAGVRIAALLYRANGQVKISLRSKDPSCPVGPIARKLGGGGHELAAGATLSGMTLDEAAEKLRGEVGGIL